LVLLLGVRDGEARADFDFGTVFGSGAYEGANDASRLGILTDIAANGMVENREDSLIGASTLAKRYSFSCRRPT
jgi:hypothetical protein